MKKLLAAFLTLFIFLTPSDLIGQNSELKPEWKAPVYFDISPPLSDVLRVVPSQADRSWKDGVVKNKINFRPKPDASVNENFSDPFLQTDIGLLTSDTTIVNFQGNSNTEGYYPPDTHGDVGPNHYFQVVNCHFSIYSKTGTLLLGPLLNSSIFSGLPNNSNSGDAVVLYDEQADRWLFSQFSLPSMPNGPFYQMIAVSVTGDPTGSWYRYQYAFTDMPDYPKFGVWPDGYYMSANLFTSGSLSWGGCLAAAFNRAQMIAGNPSAAMISFTKPWPDESSSWLPSDCDGPFPPANTPNYFMYVYNWTTNDHLGIYEFHADWNTPANSTFSNYLSIPVTSFSNNISGIDQPGTSVNLDALNDRLMYRLQYRKFNDYSTLVCNHTVDVSSSVAGIRWYELRKSTGDWAIHQQGTYGPADNNSRWMASCAMDSSGNIALGFSISGAAMYPSIRYTGRRKNDPLNQMTFAEKGIFNGTGSQTGSAARWGDYSAMSIDPVAQSTFWYTNEYLVTTSGAGWTTRIASFRFTVPPTVTTSTPTAVTAVSATLHGLVNPNGLPTSWYFQWGLTNTYGNTTTGSSAGTGTVTVSVSESISGLTLGTTYHYRLVAVNSDGTSYGDDVTFIAGGAVLSTIPVSSIGPANAVSGGTITSDGGSSITARGVCWNTTANPVVTDNHTTDGSGVGTFSSTITGLSPTTTYHVRAYATNANGTFYGEDRSFSTICGLYPLPFNESFNGATMPACWSQQNTGTGIVNSWSLSTTNNAGGSINEMQSQWQDVNPGITRLVTAPINTIGLSTLYLSFRHMLDAFGTGATLRIQSSTNGVDWTNETWAVATTDADISATIVNTTVTNNLNSSSTYLAFTITGNLYQYDFWYIDNVEVNNCVTLYPVSVSIGASANTVCAGTSVTFTATHANGGSSPTYQWRVNNNPVSGATNATYAYSPSNGDQVTCVLTSSLSCVTGNPATSNTILMTVNSLLPVSISVGASANPVCAGTSVTFTATPTNGGTSPAYQWKINSVTVPGATNSTYSYSPTNGDYITCELTSNATCISGNPATSNTILMTVNPLLPVSVSVGASANPVCAGTSVTFNATPTNGGTSPAYQWKINAVTVPGATNSTYSYSPTNGDDITCELTSNATCITGNPATSNTILMTVNPLLPVSVSVGASANPVCAGTSVTFTATPTNGGTSPAYQWKVNGNSISGATNATYAYVPSNGDQVTCVLTSSLGCVTGNPASSNAITMTVTSTLPVSVSIGASANPVCAGTSVTFTATPTNGGTSPAYQWKINAVTVPGATNSTYGYSPTNGDYITCELTSNATCITGNPATSNTILMTVNPLLPVSVSVGASANPVCAGTSVTFTATPINGGTSPSYQWKINSVTVPGATNSTYGYAPTNGDYITCELTSNATCITGNPATSNTILMSVNPNLPVSVSVGASANPVCAGTSVIFTATPTNGGTSPAYQWKINAVTVPGATNSTYSYAPTNGDDITCELTSNATCITGNPATSNTILMTVNPLLPVSVSVGASANPVCAGTSVTFTATPTNGGTSPAYQWKINSVTVPGATNSTYSYSPTNGDYITCELTSNATCITGNPATSNTILMTVNSLLPVSVSVGASANPVCAGTSVTFTATPTNGGTSPAYQWKINSVTVPGATNSTYSYSPTNGDYITCELTSNATCITGNPATSNTILMSVNSLLPASVSVGASANPVCAGTSVTFNATPTNGGTSPAYQWKINSVTVPGATNSTYSYAPTNGDDITCELTSNATCITGNPAISNTILMTVNPLLPVSVSVGASANPVCAGTSVTFTATPTNGGISPSYQWKVNGNSISGATNATYAYVPSNGDQVTCVLTSSLGCVTGNPATSNALTMSVTSNLPVSVSVGASANPVCAGTSVTFTATPTNGGTSPSYQWKVNGNSISGATNATYAYVPSNGDQVTCVLTSSLGCVTGNPATSNTITMSVNPNLPVSVSIGASANPICAGSSVTFTATATNGGSSPTYQWRVNNNPVSGATNATYAYSPSNGDQVTCVLTSSLSCVTGNPATSNTIFMTVNPLLPVSVSVGASANPVCAGTSVTFTATPTNGGTSPAYQWFVNGTPQVTGSPVHLFTSSPVFTYTPADGDQVTCELTSSLACVIGNPATSNAILMSVNPNLPVSISIGASANPVCAGTSVTFTATPTNGGTLPAYQWKINAVTVPGATNSTYSYSPTNGDYITCELTSNATCITGNPATSNTILMTVNPLLPVSVSVGASANPVCAGTSVTFTATPTNGGTSPAYQWKTNSVTVPGATNSTYSYAPTNGDYITCELTSSLACVIGNPATSNTILMSVNPNLPVSVSIDASSNPVCAGTSVTFTATPVNGGTSPAYQWKINSVTVPGATNSTYSYSPTNGDYITCELTSNATCITGNPATSNAILMTVNPLLPVSVSVGASANPVCAGTSVTFTATPTNGGTSPAYQWFVNGTPQVTGSPVHLFTSSPVFTYTPADGDQVTCELTSSLACVIGNPASSNTILMSVNPNLPVSVSIGTSANPVCAGTSVTFTATPTNGGTSPAYQWFVNGTPQVTGSPVHLFTSSPVFTYTPANGDQVTCELTSSLACVIGNPASSNTILMSVNPNLPVSVSIGASANPVCTGTSVTFTATPTNGGTSPAYQWFVNGTPQVTGSPVHLFTSSPVFTYTPANGDQVTCELTSSLACVIGNPASSNTILMSVNPNLPVSVSIANVYNPVCEGSYAVVVAFPINPGTDPSYLWTVNGQPVAEQNSILSYFPQNNDVVQCLFTSGLECTTGNPALSNSVQITVQPVLTAGVSISASMNPTCSNHIVTFNATAENGGLAPGFQWRVNGINVGGNNPFLEYVPVSGDRISCVMTSSLPCLVANPVISDSITMIVEPVACDTNITTTVLYDGDTECYDALHSITFGGNGSVFRLFNGAEAIAIAGQRISLKDGTSVANGGRFHGYIAPGGPWCTTLAVPLTSIRPVSQVNDHNDASTLFKVFPNPTSGLFTLTVNGVASGFDLKIFNAEGRKVQAGKFPSAGSYEISLKGYPTGLYLFMISAEGRHESGRLVLIDY